MPLIVERPANYSANLHGPASVEIIEAGSTLRPALNTLLGDFVSVHLWKEAGRFDRFSSFGVFHDGRLIAGLLWHNWQPEAGVIELSAAAIDRRWLTRQALRTMFDVPFRGWGCQLAVLRVSPRNAWMLHIARRFGFKEYRVPRLRGRTEDEIIFTFTDDQWASHPLSRNCHGQAIRSRAA